jgi:hypothetical protein
MLLTDLCPKTFASDKFGHDTFSWTYCFGTFAISSQRIGKHWIYDSVHGSYFWLFQLHTFRSLIFTVSPATMTSQCFRDRNLLSSVMSAATPRPIELRPSRKLRIMLGASASVEPNRVSSQLLFGDWFWFAILKQSFLGRCIVSLFVC